MTSEPRRRKAGDILIAIAGIVAGIWVTYWYVANQAAFFAIDRVLAAAGRGAQTAECGPKTSNGFPLRLDIACGAFRLADQGSGASLSTAGFSATAPLYWPLHLDATAPAPAVLKTSESGAEVTAKWSKASARIDAGLRGLSGGSAQFRGLDLDGQMTLSRLALSGLTADEAEFTAAPVADKPGDYGVSTALDGIRPRAADARALPEISATAQLTALGFGRSLGIDPKGTYEAWIRKGGSARLDKLLLTVGPVTVNASGPLTVSPDGLLSGKITLRFVGLDQLPAVLEAYQPGSRNAVAFARLLTAVTRKVDTEAGPERQAVLNLSDGNLFFGIVPIGRLPPLL